MTKVRTFLAVALTLLVSSRADADSDGSLCHRQRSCIHLTSTACSQGKRSVCMSWETSGCYKGSNDKFPHVCNKDGEVTTSQNMWSPNWENRVCITSEGPDFGFAIGDESDCNGAFSGTVEHNGETGQVQCASAYPAIKKCGGEKRQCIWRLVMPECNANSPTSTTIPAKLPTKLPSPTPTKTPVKPRTSTPTNIPKQ